MTTAPAISTARDILRAVAERTMAYDFTLFFWGDAIAMDGLLEAAELLDDPRPRDFCLPFYQRFARQPLTWASHLTPGVALLRLHAATGDAELLHAAKRLAHWIVHEVPKAAGAPLYRPDLWTYRHNVWVDTIYHEPPFLSLLASVSGDFRYHDDAIDVWTSHSRVLSSEQGPFLAHSYDTGARRLRGYGWGRGNGWALFGMVDTLGLLPEDYPSRAEALQGFRDLAAEILSVQDASGFWRTLLHDREAYLESSTATFFGAAFTKAVRLGLLDNRYAEAAERAWQATLSRVSSDGEFFGVSAVTHATVNPDDDIVMYRTLPTEVNIWGQGSALRFAAERIRAGLE